MHPWIRLLFAAAGLLMGLLSTATQAQEQPEWPFRYLMIVEHEGSYYAGVSNAKDQRKAGENVTYLEAYVKPTLLIRRKNKTGFALFLLEFDRQGRLLDAKTRKPTQFVGVQTRYPNSKREPILELARIKNGVVGKPDVTLGFYNDDTQEFCDSPELERMLKEDITSPDDTELSEIYAFWCRDWRRQMNSPRVKIINVTSNDEGMSFIGDFLGHALFTDPKKPVWGQHLDRYYCLADCPEGRPGRVKWEAPFRQQYRDY